MGSVGVFFVWLGLFGGLALLVGLLWLRLATLAVIPPK